MKTMEETRVIADLERALVVVGGALEHLSKGVRTTAYGQSRAAVR